MSREERKMDDKSIEEFRVIWKRVYGCEISPEEARIKGGGLIELFKVIYRQIPDKPVFEKESGT